MKFRLFLKTKFYNRFLFPDVTVGEKRRKNERKKSNIINPTYIYIIEWWNLLINPSLIIDYKFINKREIIMLENPRKWKQWSSTSIEKHNVSIT